MEDIKAKIKQRRLQMLVHSYIYYKMDQNLVSDAKWAEWGKELQSLQEKYPIISAQVEWADAFKGWDASTGAFLPLDDEWVKNKAEWLLKISQRQTKSVEKRSLF